MGEGRGVEEEEEQESERIELSVSGLTNPFTATPTGGTGLISPISDELLQSNEVPHLFGTMVLYQQPLLTCVSG